MSRRVAVEVFGYGENLFEIFRGEDLYEMFYLYDSINKYTSLYLWYEIVYNKAK